MQSERSSSYYLELNFLKKQEGTHPVILEGLLVANKEVQERVRDERYRREAHHHSSVQQQLEQNP